VYLRRSSAREGLGVRRGGAARAASLLHASTEPARRSRSPGKPPRLSRLRYLVRGALAAFRSARFFSTLALPRRMLVGNGERSSGCGRAVGEDFSKPPALSGRW